MYDIIIIGAGASGLMAAWDLSVAGKKVAVVEAKNRIGGRILDIRDPHFESIVELGAEFIHGDLELSKFLLKKAGAEMYERTGNVYKHEHGKIEESDFIEDYSTLHKKFKELKYDIPVQQFLNEYLAEQQHEELRKSLQKYVEGYYAADMNKASTFALRNEFENSSEKQYGIREGYTSILKYLHKELSDRDCAIFLSSPVSDIEWKKDAVTVKCGNTSYTSDKILITVSVGVLQSGSITFSPTIENSKAAADKLGFGNVIKVIMQFEKPFWKEKEELKKLSFLFSEQSIPTWWTTFPKEENTLVGWLGGPDALRFKNASESEITSLAIGSLSTIFSIDQIHLRQMLLAAHCFNWLSDPYTLGAYSYDVVNGYKYKEILRQPIDDTIFFAGEGLFDGPEIGTVEAALQTGRFAAQQLLKTGNR